MTDVAREAIQQPPLAFVRAQAKPYRWLFSATLVSAALSGVFSLAPFLAIYGIVKAVDDSTATIYGVAMIAFAGVTVTLLHLVFAALATLGGHKTAFAIQRDLRLRLLDGIVRAPVSRVEGRAGEIKKTVLGDVDRLEGLLAHVVPDIAAGLSATIAGAVVLALIDWRLLLAALCLLPIALLAQVWMFGGRTELFERWNATEATANAAMLSYVRGIATLRAFNRQASTLENVRMAIDELRHLAVIITRKSRHAYSLFNSVLATNLLAVLPLALMLHAHGALDSSQFVLAVTLGASLVAPLNKAVFATMIAQRSSVAVSRIQALLSVAPLPDTGAATLPHDNSLRLETVSFAYPDGPTILHDIDLDIAEGSMVAIVGPSGAGKSTLARLLLRMEDPTSGSLSLGGIAYRSLPLKQLRSRMGAVFQDSILFHGTIAENLALSAPNSQSKHLAQALQRSSAVDIAGSVEATLSLSISDRGQRLSGGEKQRVAIARALAKDAPILLLDEATASVDAIGEAAIQHALNEASSGRTVIVIAHRLNTVRNADAIVVLKAGRIEAIGRHADLLGISPTYRALHDAQQRALGWELVGRGKGSTQ